MIKLEKVENLIQKSKMQIKNAVPGSKQSFYDQLDELWPNYNNLGDLLENNYDEAYADSNLTQLPPISDVIIQEGFKSYRGRDYAVIVIKDNNGTIIGASITSD